MPFEHVSVIAIVCYALGVLTGRFLIPVVVDWRLNIAGRDQRK